VFENYADYEYALAQVQLVLFMLGMGATLRPADFAQVALRPRFLLVGAGCQFLLAPLLAVLLSRWWDLEPGIAVGMILIAAMPGGQMSKLFTYLARGNVALSITLSALGSFAALVTVPLLLDWLAEDYLRQHQVALPPGWELDVVRDVALYLLLPLLAGLAVGRCAPGRRLVFSRACIRVGLVFVAVMVVGSLGSGRIEPASQGWKVPLAIIVFCVGAMQLTMLPFRLLRWSKPDAVAVGIEVTMRNVNLALLVKALLFPASDAVGNGVLFVVLFYGAAAMVAGLPLALRYRRAAGRSQLDAPC
jgi:BASS family bile acid:Na+ symporter